MKIVNKFLIPPKEVGLKGPRDGQKIVCEVRMGWKGGALTRDEAFKLIGYEKRYFDRAMMYEKKFGAGSPMSKEAADNVEDKLWNQLNRLFPQVRSRLNHLVKSDKVVVMAAFVPMAIKGGNAFFVQGLKDIDSGKPVLGDPNDWALWSEATATFTKPMKDKYDEAIVVAKHILKLPHVSKDIQQRMSMVVDGEATRAGLLEHIKGQS